MPAASLNEPVSDFCAAATGDQTVSLASLKGRNVVIYFYPKDSTPGCTTEGQNFRDRIEDFAALNTVIFGVSKDSLKSHENFRTKQCFPFDLLSDPDEALCQQFDVIKEKNMYGRKYMGIERSTFLIDAEGVLRNEWRKVKVKGHVDEVFEAVKAL
jgi:peroxiredoxin Q/BCP